MHPRVARIPAIGPGFENAHRGLAPRLVQQRLDLGLLLGNQLGIGAAQLVKGVDRLIDFKSHLARTRHLCQRFDGVHFGTLDRALLFL